MPSDLVPTLVRLPPAMHLALGQLAKATGESRATIIRSCISERLTKAKRKARRARSRKQRDLV